MGTNRISAALILLLAACPLFAQIDEAREAIKRGENVRAVNILSAELNSRPDPEGYLLLSIAYANMREWQTAHDILRKAAERYPDDPRFFNQAADIYILNNDTNSARAAL